MGAQVWGTFAVNDHVVTNAFAREVEGRQNCIRVQVARA